MLLPNKGLHLNLLAVRGNRDGAMEISPQYLTSHFLITVEHLVVGESKDILPPC